MIKLTCIKCGYSYSVSENEFLLNAQYHTNCLLCQGEIVADLNEIVKTDIYERAEQYLNKWVTEIGWDNTLDLIKRNSKQSCYKIYKEILNKKGFKINE